MAVHSTKFRRERCWHCLTDGRTDGHKTASVNCVVTGNSNKNISFQPAI